MKKLKLIIWLIIIVLLGTIMWQNRDYFLAKHSLDFNLISSQYQTIELPTAFFCMVFFLFGWLIAYLFSLADRFKANNTIKRLQQTIHSQQLDIDSVKKDVQALKPQVEPAGATDPTNTRTDADAAGPYHS